MKAPRRCAASDLGQGTTADRLSATVPPPIARTTTSSDQQDEFIEALLRRWVKEKFPKASYQEATAINRIRREWDRYRGPAHSAKRAGLISELRGMLSDDWRPPA